MSEFQASNFKKAQGGGASDIVGKTELPSSYFFVPPSGSTAERPQSCSVGTVRFNTDVGTLEVYRGDTIGWEYVEKKDSQYLGGGTGSNSGTGYRVCCLGGGDLPNNPASATNHNIIDFITSTSLGNAQDFGDLVTDSRVPSENTCASNTRGMIAGGGQSNVIQFITISSTGNAQDFGDLAAHPNVMMQGQGLSNQTRGIFAGGYAPQPAIVNVISYVTIAQQGNAVDFGDMIDDTRGAASFSSSTRGIFHAGRFSNPVGIVNTIQHITISTTGDAQDFGDATDQKDFNAGGSNATRGIVFGGRTPDSTNTIEFVTIATLGNALDFGDMIQATDELGAAAAGTRAFSLGGTPTPAINIISFVEISTRGNAEDFGDLTKARFHCGGLSNGHGGL